jgi:hypothetical protein
VDRNAHNVNDMSNAPAVGRENWLPEGLFPELDELRDRHVRLLELRRENSEANYALLRQWEAEDAAFEAATREQIADPEVELPEITVKEDRERAREPIVRRNRALAQEFADLVVDVLATVEAKGDEWLGEIEGQAAGFNRDIEELMGEIAELESEIRSRRQVRDWILRTSGRGRRAWVGRLRVVSFEECTGGAGDRWRDLKRMLAHSLEDDTGLQEIDQERDELEEGLTHAAA